MALQRVLAELAGLERDGIVKRLAIGGAIGASRYIAAAATEDVDVFVAFLDSAAASLTPLAPIYDHLKARGAMVEGAHLVIDGWPVQFLAASGALLEDALAEAEAVETEGVITRFFSAEHLAAIALQVGRAKDKLRVVQMIEQSALDLPRFHNVVKRHGLEQQWNEFSNRVLGGR